MQNAISRSALGTVLILLIPLVAMQFTDEVVWDLTDFAVAGVLLFITGLVLTFTTKRCKKPAHRIIATVVIVGILLLVWAELGVGIFGTPWAGS